MPFVLEGPTGVGKTVCALSSTISLALAMDKRVLYLTRTNSQQTQVMREARAIKEFGGTEKKVTACGIQGRQRSCPLIKVDTDLQGGTPEELSKVCGRKKRLALENKPGGCPYYKGFRDMDRGEVFRWMSEKVPTPEAVAERLIPMGVCPYEASKEFMSEALVVSAPYVYFFNIGVRRAILESMRCSIPDLIVVVDEAHNLPEYARDLMSPKMGLFTVERAIAEVKKKGDPEVAPGIKASELCEAIGSAISGIAEEYCQEQDDALLPAVEFSVRLLSYLGTTSNKLETAVRGLLAMGEQMRQERLNRGKLPRSFAHSLALFMEEWNAVSEENYVHLALSSPVSIEAYCLDPTRATGELSNAAWSLHMSGTLRPLEEYRDSLGLEGGMLHISPSPFPPENRG
ncbi:MAG: hypothetical protein KAT70_00755, partial [Thermoplasmata archaeon]|nr:hypothetical protein [Thermoplasmata archaeon]